MDTLEKIVLRDLQKFMKEVIKLRVKEFHRNGFGIISPNFESWWVVATIEGECLTGRICEGWQRINDATPEFRIHLGRTNYRELYQQKLLELLIKRTTYMADHHTCRMQVAEDKGSADEHRKQLDYYMGIIRNIGDALKEIALEGRRAKRVGTR